MELSEHLMPKPHPPTPSNDESGSGSQLSVLFKVFSPLFLQHITDFYSKIIHLHTDLWHRENTILSLLKVRKLVACESFERLVEFNDHYVFEKDFYKTITFLKRS